MFFILRFVHVHLLIFTAALCHAQAKTDFTLTNNRKLDTMIAHHSGSCDGLFVLNNKYKKKLLRKDRALVSLINRMNHGEVSRSSLPNEISKMRHSSIDSSNNGLIEVVSLKVLAGYLEAKLELEFIGDTLVRKFTFLDTRTHTICGATRILDFNLIRMLVFPELEESFSLTEDHLESDTVFLHQVRALESRFKDYRFGTEYIQDEDLSKSYVRDQFKREAIYFYDRAVPAGLFVRLISNRQYDIISDVLFSPNYQYAIQAMEALMFLQKRGDIQLTALQVQKMNDLRSDIRPTVIVGSHDSDVLFRFKGYAALDTKESTIYWKYENAIKKYKAN